MCVYLCVSRIYAYWVDYFFYIYYSDVFGKEINKDKLPKSVNIPFCPQNNKTQFIINSTAQPENILTASFIPRRKNYSALISEIIS